MKNIKKLEIALLNLSCWFEVQIFKGSASKINNVSIRNVWSQNVHVSLIIDKLSLLFCSFLVGKLSSAHRVTCCHRSWSKKRIASSKNNHQPWDNHNLVNGSGVTQKLKVSFAWYFYKSWKKARSRYSIVVKRNKPIVYSIISHLCTNIANFKTWIRYVINSASDRAKERLRSVVIFPDLHSREYNCMCTNLTECSWPELCCSNVRGMNDKFIGFLVEGRCCLKSSYVWSMAKFCLNITTNYMKIIS